MSSVRVSMKFSVLIAMVLILTASFVEAAPRDTRTLVLGNGLAVILISDPEVDRSAAALSVGVGHLYDPESKMGLAHYLEHMLFLGTEKFPKVGSYKEYLNANSGASNAYTGADITNYFFQVSHTAFEGALDRFSDFFRAPLFDKKYAEREVNAVNSEFEKNKLQDGWRSNHLINQISEEGHPLRKFGIGNKDTLAGDNRSALIDFYTKFYSASNMKLAVLSNLSLAEQEAMIKKYFSDIPNRPVALISVDTEYRKPLKGKYRLLKIKSIKDVRSLSIEFPTIRLHDHLDSKPASVVGSVIGYEGKGSLLSKLKEEGWVLSLSAGGGSSHPNLSSFDISVSLTQKGEKEYERVLEHIFAYIQTLKDRGFAEYTFKENQTMAQIDFDWKSPQEGMGFAASKASLMQKYELSEVETLPFLYRKYEPSAQRAILQTLTPENMLAVLTSQKVATDQVEKFFGTEYSLEEVGGQAFERLAHPAPVPGLTYPEKNDFIPYNLALTEEPPTLVRDDEIAKVWFKFDDRFKQPKVYMQLRIETPHIYDTADNLARSKLYDAAIHEGLNEMTYPISLAGLSYNLGIEKKGMTLGLGGYTERISDLLKLVAQNLTKVQISEQKFLDIKEAIIRNLENRKLGQAYSRASYYNQQIWLVKQYSHEQALAALNKVTLADIKDYARTLYERVFITGVVHGNWSQAKVRESLDILLAEMNSRSLPEEDKYKEVVEVLDAGELIRFSKKVADNNNALYYSLQVGERTLQNSAKVSLVSSIIKSDFYTQMRTNQQLGYVVWSFNGRMEDRLFFKFIIQSSTYGPFELQKRVEAWMNQSSKLFDGLSDEEFEKHRQGLIVSLEKKADSISEKAGDYYYAATEEDGNFDYRKDMVKAVKSISKQDVIAEGKRLFADPTIARTIFLIRSNANNEPVPEGVLTTVEQFKNRKNKQAGVLTGEKS